MKKTFSFKKILLFCLILLGFYVLFLALGMLVGFSKSDPLLGLGIGAVIGGVVFILPAIYYIFSLISFAKHYKKMEVITATVENWNRAFPLRTFANISIKQDGVEISTHSYFFCEEARGYIGKKIKCQIINDTLFILEVLNNDIATPPSQESQSTSISEDKDDDPSDKFDFKN